MKHYQSISYYGKKKTRTNVDYGGHQKEKGRLDQETMDNMEELSKLTKNFSGAEIEGLVKSAASYAFTRGIDVKNLDKAPDPKNLIVTWKVGQTSGGLELHIKNVRGKYNSILVYVSLSVRMMSVRISFLNKFE